MERKTQGIRPSVLEGVTGTLVFAVPLKHDDRHYGDLRIECAYGDDDMGTMRQLQDAAPKSSNLTVAIDCRTAIGSDLYAADDVCRFAAKLLEVGYGAKKDDIVVEVGKTRVTYKEHMSLRPVTISALYAFALEILHAYATRFSDNVAALPEEGTRSVADLPPELEAGAPEVEG